MPTTLETDVLIIGAGAAGLLCAAEAGKRGRRVIVLDHARKPAEKLRISGGGRCNFTNLHTAPENYLSQNPAFCISALSRYTPRDFLSLVEKHGIPWHEKTLGQLFCDRSSQDIVNLLLAECRAAKVTLRLQTKVATISRPDARFCADTQEDKIFAESLVIASGGLSIPKMGATGFGYEVARQFGLAIVPTRAALVPFTFSEAQLQSWGALAGVSVQAAVQCGKQSFGEGLLFTHRGLSGPAALQISSYWQPKQTLRIDLAPEHDVNATLRRVKTARSAQELTTALSDLLPKRVAGRIAEQHLARGRPSHLGSLSDRQLGEIAAAVNAWQVMPHGTEGYRTAEVTLGGVDTKELSSQTMASRKTPNLYFIGEVVDVTGHLGGFNFQWAWASGFVAGQYA